MYRNLVELAERTEDGQTDLVAGTSADIHLANSSSTRWGEVLQCILV